MSEPIKFKVFDKTFSVKKNYQSEYNFKIKSNLGDYQVEYTDDSNFINKINALLQDNRKNILFCDEKVYKLYGKRFHVEKSQLFIGPANEEFKTIGGALQLIDFMQETGFTKQEKLIVVGGGIIQDVAAFAGATYKRGIEWCFFPSTLLAMCDSCIGAKSSINYKGVKNQLGLFSAPNNIIINIDFIKTLDNKDISNGLGEIYKLCIVGGVNFVSLYNSLVCKGRINKDKDYVKLIQAALFIKKSVIEVDEFDLSYRKSLNYGHTFGHALEVMSNFEIPHGQAVAIGIVLVNDISKNRKFLEKDVNDALKLPIMELLDKKTLNIMGKIIIKDIGRLLLKDKKTLNGKVNFIMLNNVGNTRLAPIEWNAKLEDELNSIVGHNFK